MHFVLFAGKIKQWRLPGDPARGGDIDAPVPKIKDDEKDKWFVGAEVLVYLKYLIYSAGFKVPTVKPRGSIHAEFCSGWRRTFCLHEDLISRKMQLECWYAKHPPRNRRVVPKDDDMYNGGSDGEHQSAALSCTMMMMLNHHKRMLNECMAMAALEFE